MNSSLKPQALLRTALRTRPLCSIRSLHQNHLTLVTSPRHARRSVLQSYTDSSLRNRIRHASYEQQAKALNQKGVDKQLDDHDARIAEDQEKQRQAPWHREGSDRAPVNTQRQAGAMTKGKSLPGLFMDHALMRSRKITHHSLKTPEACSTFEHRRS